MKALILLIFAVATVGFATDVSPYQLECINGYLGEHLVVDNNATQGSVVLGFTSDTPGAEQFLKDLDVTNQIGADAYQMEVITQHNQSFLVYPASSLIDFDFLQTPFVIRDVTTGRNYNLKANRFQVTGTRVLRTSINAISSGGVPSLYTETSTEFELLVITSENREGQLDLAFDPSLCH